MRKRFEDKIVLVTGGTSGIGFEAAKLFEEEGARVVVLGHNKGKGDDAIKELGEGAWFVQADVRNEDEVKKAIKEIVAKEGKLDILVNSAGISVQDETDVTTFSEADFDATMDVNFKGTFLATKHAIPYLLKTKGNIVNIGSGMGLRPAKDDAFIYASSKAAVIMFTKAIALNYAGKGVRVNCVCPGATDTPMLREVFPDEEEYERYVKSRPMGRIATPREIANVIAFLASDEASIVTGGIYTADGGRSI
jgi:NAD(P)-dependent dehydrogenase (short-subunit alcohol dehydrogenase family)